MQKKYIIRHLTTIIIFIWLFFSLTITTDPGELKPFFEIHKIGDNTFHITVTGSTMEFEIGTDK